MTREADFASIFLPRQALGGLPLDSVGNRVRGTQSIVLYFSEAMNALTTRFQEDQSKDLKTDAPSTGAAAACPNRSAVCCNVTA